MLKRLHLVAYFQKIKQIQERSAAMWTLKIIARSLLMQGSIGCWGVAGVRRRYGPASGTICPLVFGLGTY